MKTRFTGMERILILSVCFSISLLVLRILYTKEYAYAFYIWNTFLAIIPFLCSRKLGSQNRMGLKSILLIGGWLLFFPNAPYLVTDLFHFTVRTGTPAWFDMILVSSSSWNGLALGIFSLLQVEQFLNRHFKEIRVRFISYAFILLCGYGIYLGRFLRFNSWDIVTNPRPLFSSVYHSVLHPVQHTGTWAFTVTFSCLLGIVYTTIKQMQKRTGIIEG
ncbi:MAG TPA: DUF1361 domain-containing protein [Puia sp.]